MNERVGRDDDLVFELNLWCEVKTGKERRGREDRRESFPYITDKALDIQNKLKHNNKAATLTTSFKTETLNL